MHVLHVVGARPNFMKAAPVYAALQTRGVEQTLVHTGQHYDELMSDVFFRQLGLPEPDLNLEIGSGTHAQQTGRAMIALEPALAQRNPTWVLVYGDVNSTMAAAIVGAKLGLSVGHVEAGLRSGDRTMPEEINRVVTDALANLLFTHSPEADDHLRREGITAEKIKRVGNVMIDTLVRLLPAAEKEWPRLQERFRSERYALVTLHRPSNVDELNQLSAILGALGQIGRSLPVIFPVHPRTRQRIRDASMETPSTVLLTEPLGYLEFLALQKHATVVITDSGGVQEETTFLGVPCLTLRENTERPITITMGTNVLIGNDLDKLQREMRRIASGDVEAARPVPLWDGRASERIADILLGRAV